MSAPAISRRLWSAGPPPLPTLSRLTLALGALAVAAGAVVAALPPVLAVAFAVAALIAPAGLAYPLWALFGAVALIPLSSEWSMTIGGLNLTLMEPAIALAAGAWLWRGARQRSLRVWPSALLVALILVWALFIAASLGAEAPGPSVKDTLKWTELLLAFALTVDLARTPSTARWLVVALVGAAALEAVWGLIQFAAAQGPSFFAVGPFMRAYGHFNQPNPFAGYLGTALPIAAAFALTSGAAPPATTRASPQGVGAPRGWAWLGAALLAAGLLASLSRGAWLGMAVALGVMLAVASPRSRRLWLVVVPLLLLLGLLGALGALPPAISERLAIVTEYFGPFDVRRVDVTPENWSVVERMAHWQAAWHMFLDSPWLGIGPGNYATQYELYYLPGWLDPLGHAHNYYLNLAAELGIIGLAGYLVVLALAFRAAIRGLRAPHPFWRTSALGVLGSLIAITLHSAFDNLFVHGVSVQVGVLLGLAAVAADRAERARE